MIVPNQVIVRQLPQEYFTSHNFNQAPANYRAAPVIQ